MPVTLQLVMKLQRLRHLTPGEAAARLGVAVAEVEAACRMLSLAMASEPDAAVQQRTDEAERAAARANRPRKMQERYDG
jgi:hypothetical protein